MAMDSIAIIGAGQAGAALAARLRQAGFQGGIDVFGAESAPPYQRPPLSKKYLAGDWEQERLWLRPAQFWREQGIALHLGGTVEALDLASRTLRCGGRRHGWRKLALTTGAAPRPLPAAFAGRSNVFELRNLADVQRLQPAFLAGRRLLVLGAAISGWKRPRSPRRRGCRCRWWSARPGSWSGWRARPRPRPSAPCTSATGCSSMRGARWWVPKATRL